MSNAFERLVKKFLPGGLQLHSDVMGVWETIGWVARTAWAYKRTAFYLLRRKGLKAVFTFVFVKLFVPVGEGAGAGFYFFASPLVRMFPQAVPFPRNVEIEVTTICDKKCIICEHTYWKDQIERNLTFGEFKHIVDQFPKLKWTNMTGEGSAFLNKDYLKMLRYLKSRNIAVYLVDHFDALDDETAREIVRLGIDGIWLSIDGATKETYEKVQVGCSFDRVQENIKKVIALKQQYKSPIPELNFRMIVTTENVHEMPQFVRMVHSYGDRNARGDGSHAEFVGLLEYEQIKHYKVPELPREIIQETIRAKKETRVELFICHTQPDQHASLDRCLAWMEPYIMMGGYVLPCCSVLMSNRRQWLREHAFGNVFEKSMKDIWYSDRYSRFRQTITKNKEKVPLFCYRCRSYRTEDRAAKYGIAQDL